MMSGDCPMMGGAMMWAMGGAWILVLILLLLGVAALVKYVFFSGKQVRRRGVEQEADE